MFRTLIAAALLLATASGLHAQTPTGSITGRVTDGSNLPVPGATVTITSPNLQGTRTAVTSANGDYIFPSLPPGPYTVTVELSGFATTKVTRDVGAGQPVQVEVALRQAALSEVVTVTARADAFTNTSQASTNIQQELLQTAAHGAHAALGGQPLACGARDWPEQRRHHRWRDVGRQSRSCSMASRFRTTSAARRSRSSSRTPSRKPRSRPPASPPSTAASPAASSMPSRKSGGNSFSGSFRTTFTNDDWRTTSPFDEPKVNDTVPTYEFTLGGPIVRRSTWFFGAGRFFDRTQANQTGYTRLPFSFDNDQKRFEGKITQAFGRDTTFAAPIPPSARRNRTTRGRARRKSWTCAAFTRASCRRTSCPCTIRERSSPTCSSKRSIPRASSRSRIPGARRAT